MRDVFLATLVLATTTSSFARAHMELQSPTARFVQNNNGLKTAPCGSGTPTGTVTPLIAGQMLTVKWRESVPHAGHYRIGIAPRDSDFVEPTNLSIPTSLPSWNVADGIADKTGTQTYTQTVQVPTTPCTKCVLQLLQVMAAGTDGTNTGSFAGVYHACADVTISAGDAGIATDALDAKPSGGDALPDTASMGGETGRGGASGFGGGLSAGGSVATGGSIGATGGSAAGGVAATGGGVSTGGSRPSESGGSFGTGGSTLGTAGGVTGAGGHTEATGGSGNGAGGHGGGSVATGSAGHSSAPGSGGHNAANQGGSSGCQVGPSGDSAPWATFCLVAALVVLSRARRRRFGRVAIGAMRSRSWTSSSCDTVAIPTKPQRVSIRRRASFR